jgi:hypothetical protein
VAIGFALSCCFSSCLLHFPCTCRRPIRAVRGPNPNPKPFLVVVCPVLVYQCFWSHGCLSLPVLVLSYLFPAPVFVLPLGYLVLVFIFVAFALVFSSCCVIFSLPCLDLGSGRGCGCGGSSSLMCMLSPLDISVVSGFNYASGLVLSCRTVSDLFLTLSCLMLSLFLCLVAAQDK